MLMVRLIPKLLTPTARYGRHRSLVRRSLPFETELFIADLLYLGNIIELQDIVVDDLNWYESFDMISINNVPDATLRSQLSSYTSNGFFYRSNFSGNTSSSSNQSSIGDARITFDVVFPDTISVISKLNPASSNVSTHDLGLYMTKRDGTLLLIERGLYTAEELFTQADQENTTMAWILRAVGFLLMVLSLLLILQPLATVVDIIPFIGDFIKSTMEGCLFPCIAILIALPTSLFVISLAWLAYRPSIAYPHCSCYFSISVIFPYVRIRKSKLHQEQNHDTSSENDVQPDKPQDFNTNIYNANLNAPYSSTNTPYNSPGHSINYKY
jgi:hypothetical protein